MHNGGNQEEHETCNISLTHVKKLESLVLSCDLGGSLQDRDVDKLSNDLEQFGDPALKHWSLQVRLPYPLVV